MYRSGLKQAIPLFFYKLTPDDENLITSIQADDFYRYSKSPTLNPHSRDESRSFAYMVYNDQSHFVGYIKGFFPVGKRHLWIQTLLVDREHIRMGYGSAIVRQLLSDLSRTHFIHKIYLTCHADNSIGHAFWSNLGFIQQATYIKGYYLYEAGRRSILCTAKSTQH